MAYGTALSSAGPELSRIMKRCEANHTNREFLLKNARGIIGLCSRSIVSVHRGDMEQGARQLDQARALFKRYKAKAGKGGLRQHLAVPEQEITEAACLIAVVRKKRIPTPRMLGVADVPYVLGLLDAIGEMKRLTLDMMRSGETSEAERIFEVTVEMYDELAGFAIYGNSVKDVRKKIDVARITIDGMRSVVAGARESGAPLAVR